MTPPDIGKSTAIWPGAQDIIYQRGLYDSDDEGNTTVWML